MPVPYSDNLYSVLDGSDSEQEDALPPTDGYFHASPSPYRLPPQSQSQSAHHPGVPFVPNVLVEDPTLGEQDVGAKAREADEEQRLNSQSASSPAVAQSDSSHVHTPSQRQLAQHHRRSVEDDSSISVYTGPSQPSSTLPSRYTRYVPPGTRPLSHPTPSEAPPAYSPRSPTSPTSAPSGPSYQTFEPAAQSATMGVPEDRQRLLLADPESMGGPPNGQQPSRWQVVKDEWHHGKLRTKVRKIVGGLLLVSIFVMIFSGFTLRPSHDGDERKKPNVIDKDPVKKPNSSHDDLEWDNLRNCYNDPHHFPKVTSRVEFDPARNLVISEKPADHDNHGRGRQPHVTGNLVIRPTDSGKNGELDLEIMSNDKDLAVEASWDDEEQRLEAITPRRVDWSAEQSPCIQIRITVWVPADSALRTLDAAVVHLDIDILEGLSLNVADKVFLSGMVGDVAAPEPSGGDEDLYPYKLASREIRVSTVSGDITGWYPLYDLLLLHSASGDVLTDIGPKDAQDKDPKPAVLDVKSGSGQLTVREPLGAARKSTGLEDNIPSRDYVAKLETVSGDMVADLAIGSSAKVQSQSGDVELRLWPVLDPGMPGNKGSSQPELVTETKSGKMDVDLLEPRWAIADGLKSNHNTISGDITLRYPASWSGTLVAETISGSQSLRGEGLSTSRKSGIFPRVIEGRKGDGSSTLKIETVSGDQDFLVGED